MRFIVIECANEYVKGAGVPIGAAGSYSDVALKIKFRDMWDGMSKHITWLDANGENPTIVYLTAQNYDGEYYTSLIPAEAKAVAGTAVMSIKGADSSKGTLTAKAEFKVLESVYDENAEESVDPTPTVAEQLQEQVESILGTISDARNAATEAAASAGAAYDSQVAAAGSESAAGGYAIEARSYAKGDTNTRTGEATDNAKYYKEQAASSASAAAGYESDSEAYAKGTRAGTAVGSTDPAYQNNSKYYSEQAASSATTAGLAETAASGYASTALGYKNDAGGYASDAAGSATDAAGSASDASDSATAAAGSASDAADSALAASGSASAASGSATAADASATEAESYAKGGTSSRTGEDTDNAKYYKEQAASSASTASGAESAAASSASDAEAAAKGTRNGTDVSSSDPFYHANARPQILLLLPPDPHLMRWVTRTQRPDLQLQRQDLRLRQSLMQRAGRTPGAEKTRTTQNTILSWQLLLRCLQADLHLRQTRVQVMLKLQHAVPETVWPSLPAMSSTTIMRSTGETRRRRSSDPRRRRSTRPES